MDTRDPWPYLEPVLGLFGVKVEPGRQDYVCLPTVVDPDTNKELGDQVIDAVAAIGERPVELLARVEHLLVCLAKVVKFEKTAREMLSDGKTFDLSAVQDALRGYPGTEGFTPTAEGRPS